MSKLPLLEARTSITGKFDSDLVAVFQDTGKKTIPPKGNYGSLVDRLRKAEAFVGKQGSAQFVRFGGKDPAENVLFVGLGQTGDLTEEKFRAAGGVAWARLKSEKIKTILVHVDSFFDAKGTH